MWPRPPIAYAPPLPLSKLSRTDLEVNAAERVQDDVIPLLSLAPARAQRRRQLLGKALVVVFFFF